MAGRQKRFLIERLGDIEYRLSIGGQEKLALGSLVSAFSQIRNIIDEEWLLIQIIMPLDPIKWY